MDRPTASGRSSALLWSAVFAPGLVCVALGVFVVDAAWMVGVGILLLVAPLVVQMFGPDWDRETIPEGHHHDHPHDHDHDHGHHHHDHDHDHDQEPDVGTSREHDHDRESDAGRSHDSAPDARGSGV